MTRGQGEKSDPAASGVDVTRVCPLEGGNPFLSSTDSHSTTTNRLTCNSTRIDMDGKVHRESFWG